MKLTCRRCGKLYPVRGYGVIMPACPYCGTNSQMVIERKPGCVNESLQTHLIMTY